MAASDGELTDHVAAVGRDFRRNVAAFAGWELVWGLGMPFAMFATFVPAYLGALGAPKALIGLVLAFPYLASAVQFLVGYWLPAANRLRVYRITIIASLLPWFVYAAASVLWGKAWPVSLHWALYALVQMAFIGVVSGLNPTYHEIMTDNVPMQRRGRLFGLRAAGVGAAGLIGGTVASRVLSHWETPRNFWIGFVIKGTPRV